MRIGSLVLSLACCGVLLPQTAYAEDRVAKETNGAHADDKAVREMSETAKNFWNALTAEQQAKAGFKFEDDERMNWHFIPKPRKGLTFKEMNSAQRDLAHAFLASGLSQKGYAEAVTIMSLDEVLKAMETKGPTRDPELYYFSIFGTPGDTQPWGWRVEGHHVSLNFTIVDGKIAVAGPAFFGSNPAKVMDGPRKGLRVLGIEEDMGRAIVKSLTDEQKKRAIVAETAPKDVLSFNARKTMLQSPVGVTYTQLNDDQKKQVVGLVTEYADRLRGELAADDLARITAAGWDKVQFAWAGGLELGQGHYYRVQGPTFLIEYDNTQNNANHVHSVWRDLTRDFGEDLLGKHLEQTKHE
jgi:hypothetical protein